jgi:hypothetical protein
MPKVIAGTVQRGVTVLNRTLMHLAVLLHVTPVSDGAICTVQLLAQNRVCIPQLECL